MPNTTLRDVTDRATFLTELDGMLHHGNAALALALADLDDFGTINESYGFDIGDQVLAAWEQALERNLPDYADVVRLGGDEYAVVLAGDSAENGLILLDEIRSHMASQEVTPKGVRVKASVGVAANPPHGATGEELLRAAGQALMRAKRAGRDQIAIYVEEKMVLKSNYYSRASLDRLAKLSSATGRTEASLLREALDDALDKYRLEL